MGENSENTSNESISYQVNDVIFCLDYNPMVISQTSEESELVSIEFYMKFEGYGLDDYRVTQKYEYLFFDGKVEIFPGEEVEDFFMDVSRLDVLKINEGSITVPTLIYNTARVNITIIEENRKKKVFKKHYLRGLRYLPGKKPVAYPYLTNSRSRRTFSQSLILLSAIGLDFKSKELSNLIGNKIDESIISEDFGIYSMFFRKLSLDSIVDYDKILTDSYISLEPMPEVENIIDVIFINQNLCPDWFSFSEEWEEHSELEHVLSLHSQKGVDFKVATNEKKTLKLNTGWIFEEEVPLLTEMMKSKYCFVKIRGEWTRCIPITKKPLRYDSERNIHSQIIEFQIVKENER